MKEKYEGPKMDVVMFDEEDVITASCPVNAACLCDLNWDNCMDNTKPGNCE